MMKIFSLIGLLAVAALSTTPAAADVTRETCEADYAAMVQTAKDNRARSIAELEDALRFTANEDAVGDLARQIDQAWEHEEMFLNRASHFYRDCVKYAESGGS